MDMVEMRKGGAAVTALAKLKVTVSKADASTKNAEQSRLYERRDPSIPADH